MQAPCAHYIIIIILLIKSNNAAKSIHAPFPPSTSFIHSPDSAERFSGGAGGRMKEEGKAGESGVGGKGAIVAPGLNPICPSLHRNGGHQSAAESKVVMWVLSSAPWHRVLKRCQPFTVPLAVFSTTFRLKATSFSEHDSRVGELIGTIRIRPGRSDRLISIGVSFTHRKRKSPRFF